MLIPFFKKGSLLSITLQYYQASIQNIQGICIKKKNQGNTSYFSLSYLIPGTKETIIQTNHLRKDRNLVFDGQRQTE